VLLLVVLLLWWLLLLWLVSTASLLLGTLDLAMIVDENDDDRRSRTPTPQLFELATDFADGRRYDGGRSTE
jgi:hypothetical protein